MMAKKETTEKNEKMEEKETTEKATLNSIKIDKKVIKETEKLMKELIDLFGIDAEVAVSSDSYENKDGLTEEFVDVKITGEDIGVLIGYLGRNLRSLQRIVALMLNRRLDVNRDESAFVRVVLDVSGYREKRKESLEQLADRIRQEVLESGKSVDMRPMTSYERRVVHTHLLEFGDVTTESFGEGDARYVRVFPAGGVKNSEEVEVNDDNRFNIKD